MPWPKSPFALRLPLSLLLVFSLYACTVVPVLSASPDVRYNEFFPAHFKRMDARDYFEPGPQQQLATAAARGNAKDIEQALAAGANVNHAGRNGMTPLYWAMGKQNIKGFRLLLEHGANPQIETRMPEGWRPPYESAMSLAAIMESPDYLGALLDHGATPDMVINSSQETAIFRTIMNRRGENLRLLIERGANINYQAQFGETPLQMAVTAQIFGAALELIRAGADPTIGGTMRFVARDLERDTTKFGIEFHSFIAELKRRGYIKSAERQ